jgi:MYXO-CTERM domain-containing protein
VDASGARTPLDVRLSGGDIELRVPERLVEQSAYPATLDPILGVEFALEPPVFFPTTDVGYPGMASDGTNYLVTWSERFGVYAARVSAAGTLLQPARIDVAGNGPVKGHICRPGTACDLAGVCDGTTTACPPDFYLPPNTVCGDAGACTAAPLCSGTSATCDPGVQVPDGTSCGTGGTCSAGTCVVAGVDAGSEAGEGGAHADADVADGAVGEDASVADSGAPDASPPDAQADSGDAAATDGGHPGHAGAAPPEDSGVDGSVAHVDAAARAPDAGDGAVDAGGGGESSSGCSCRTTREHAGQGWTAGIVGVLVFLARRRRRRVYSAPTM